MTTLQAHDIRATMTCLALNGNVDENLKICSCDSTDDESNTDVRYGPRNTINRHPSDEDIEASRHWNYNMVPSIHKLGHGRDYIYTKEEHEKWGRKALEKWQTGEKRWSTRVMKPKPKLEGWAKWAQENPEKCRIRMR